MSSIPPSISGGIGALYAPTISTPVATPPSGGASSGVTKPGAGALATRQISVGSGEARSESSSAADKAKAFFKTAGKVVAGIVLAPVALGVGAAAVGLGLAVGGALLATRAVLQIPRLINQHVLEPKSDRTFEIANRDMLTQLRTPIEGSITADAAVMARVEKHAEAMGTPLSKDELRNLVAAGERMSQGLAALAPKTPDAHGMVDVSLADTPPVPLPPGGSPLTLNVDGKLVAVESNMHTTRALAWYMMAAAAGQDEARAQSGDTSGKSDMVSSGALRMKDPGNNIHTFLSAAPTAASRMSTHFAEVVDHNEKHKACGLIPTGKPAQRGIEDYRNQLPGQGGTMLFDKLKSSDGTQDLFVKFESVGCPPYFKTEAHQGKGQAVARFFSALDRNIGHATNFIGSKFDSTPTEGVVKRQEHVYKGVLKESVAKPFAKLLDSAMQAGVVDASAKDVKKSLHKFGMPYVHAALDRMESHARTLGNAKILGEIASTRAEIQTAVDQLGAQSDRHGIDRRGAEVHISMTPADNSDARRL
jgi:hypothetical protein